LKELAEQEIESLKKRRDELVQDLRVALLPKDTTSEKDAIVEIRAAPAAKRRHSLPEISTDVSALCPEQTAGGQR